MRIVCFFNHKNTEMSSFTNQIFTKFHGWSCHIHPSSRCKIYFNLENSQCFHVIPIGVDKKLSMAALKYRAKESSNEYWETFNADGACCLYYSSLKKDKDFMFNIVFPFLGALDDVRLAYNRIDEKSKTSTDLELVKYHCVVHRNGKSISFCNRHLLRENKINKKGDNIYGCSKSRANILKSLFGIKSKPHGSNTSDIPNWVIDYVSSSNKYATSGKQHGTI